ncbi:MAG TPA: rhamnan synthesis F family protein, partial [bacterium]|nr:rhamnan synthesis F family protein [bacterium]
MGPIEALRLHVRTAVVRSSGFFDAEYYRSAHPELEGSGVHPLEHYLRTGPRQGSQPHPLFDPAYYRTAYPDIAASGTEPLVHFLLHGAAEGRDPHPLFDTDYYVKHHPLAGSPGAIPLLHYWLHGQEKGCDPHPDFDSRFYVESHPETDFRGCNLLWHYLSLGSRMGLDPNPLFDTAWYLRQNPDVAQSGINPLVHYVRWGRKQGLACQDAQQAMAGMRVAVVLHAATTDAERVVTPWLENIPAPFDLYVTVRRGAKQSLAEPIAARHPSAVVIEGADDGTGLKTFVDLLAKGTLSPYDAVCRLHDGTASEYPDALRHLQLSGLLGSPGLVAAALALLRRDSTVALVGPETLYLHGRMNLGPYEAAVQAILGALDPGAMMPPNWGFFPGGMFWMRPGPFLPLCRALRPHGTGNAPGLPDGPLEQPLERVFGLLVRHGGLRTGLAVMSQDSL